MSETWYRVIFGAIQPVRVLKANDKTLLIDTGPRRKPFRRLKESHWEKFFQEYSQARDYIISSTWEEFGKSLEVSRCRLTDWEHARKIPEQCPEEDKI